MEKINFILNGQSTTMDVTVEASALDVIRDGAKLTGTKHVCGSGACGACTVLLDGDARCSCLMPALQMHGKQVTTVEGIAGGQLHPVQKAFLAHDGLQCGYCTPGFIVEATAIYDAWKAAGRQGYPSRDEVAEALAGHLCRCGAYQGIYEAVQQACAGTYDGPDMPDFMRVDGIPKVTGAAKYTTDIQLPGQLVGMLFRSTHPHSRITKLDLAAAQALPGVKAVIRLLEEDESRYEGEPIAAVAAETMAMALAALKAIVYEFEPLPFVLDPKMARKADAPLVFPDTKKEVPTASEGPAMPGNWEGNVRNAAISIASSNRSKARKGSEKADKLQPNYFEGTFKTPTQFHTTLEPHCAIADWRADGKLVVYVSTQSVYWIAKDIAAHFDLKEEDVQVYADYVGGAFGAKLALRTETLVAIALSRIAKLPVALIYSRAEELAETGYRPATEIEMQLSCDADGANAGYSMHAYASSGIAVGSTVADIAGLSYTGINKDLHDYDVVTNYAPASAFRGPGGPAALFALEQSIDQVAHQMQIDPVDFRKKWELDPGYTALFKWAESLPLWKNRAKLESRDPRYRVGVGLACGGWFHIYMPIAEVEVAISAAGLSVSNAVQDMGQGSKSVLARAVADVFGVSPQSVKVIAGDSKLLVGPASGGSRTTVSIYPAAKEAAEKLRDRILLALTSSEQLQNATLKEGGIGHDGGLLPWAEVFTKVGTLSEIAKRGRNDSNSALGMLPLPQGMSMGKGRSSACYVIAVEVDTLLGKVRVTEVHGAMRVGKIHVRPLALSQCYGGVIQGIGHVLYEDRSVCATTGRLLSRGLEDYRIPGIGDIPPIQIDFLEEGFEFVKEKGVGLAELCTIPVAGAVANAVFNATGWRPMQAPILPKNVLAGLNA